jgi:N-acyl homoserine lactone hydrolase
MMIELVQGYPGKSTKNGGLGWSSVTLVRHGERLVLADTGSFGMRSLLADRLAEHSVAPSDVTDILLSHVHYDHAANFLLFPEAQIWIAAAELDWAVQRGPAFDPVPELYGAELARNPRTRRISGDGEILPGVEAFSAPGHTPGSLVYRITDADGTLLFTGDAAKNRAELLSGEVDMTLDCATSRQTVAKIGALWRARPDTVLIPGHDLPMRWSSDGPEYLAVRTAGIRAWFSDDLSATTHFDLTNEGDR